MTIFEFKTKIANGLKDFIENREKDALIISNDYTALIIDRLINEGVGSDNQKFPLYSQREIPSNYFADGNRAGAAKRFAKTDQPKTYENWRKFNGLPIDKRTHSFTGDMLKSVRPIVVDRNDNEIVVDIQPNDSENKDKIRWNSSRLNTNLLAPTFDEIQFVDDANEQRIEKYFNFA